MHILIQNIFHNLLEFGVIQNFKNIYLNYFFKKEIKRPLQLFLKENFIYNKDVKKCEK